MSNNSTGHYKRQTTRDWEFCVTSHSREYLTPTSIVNDCEIGLNSSAAHQVWSLVLWDFLSPELNITSSLALTVTQEDQAFTRVHAFTRLNTFHTQAVPHHQYSLAHSGFFFFIFPLQSFEYSSHYPTPLYIPLQEEHIDSPKACLFDCHTNLFRSVGVGWRTARWRGVFEINRSHSSNCRKATWEEGKGSPHPKPHLANNKRMPRWRCISILHLEPLCI